MIFKVSDVLNILFMQPFPIKTINEFHEVNGLKPPLHPLISIADYASIAQNKSKKDELLSTTFDFYVISKKRGLNGKMRYGQQDYDFNEGIMYFMSPGQILQPSPKTTTDEKPSGKLLLIHPDFIWNTPLANTIHKYEFFDYAVNEALFLSEKEESVIDYIYENIEIEYSNNIDKYSQNIIISQIETLLNYCERFYNRQFITRQKAGNEIISKLELILRNYFEDENLIEKGLPSVKYISEQLNVSSNYLGAVLKNLTGNTTQKIIQDKIIEKAKEKLATTSLTVSEIAYNLGFEHPQSFNKLFKNKTEMSPLEFRSKFN